MKPEAFIKAYEAALATQDWHEVEPLISKNASVSFSNGSVHIGKDQVRAAYEHNFNTIKSEHYAIKNVNWRIKTDHYAVYLFEYSWSGIINDQAASGNGIGTAVIIKKDEHWQLLTEHLGKVG